MDHRIYGTILFLCIVTAFTVYVLEDSGIVKKDGPPAVIGGWACVVGFSDIVIWIILYIWS